MKRPFEPLANNISSATQRIGTSLAELSAGAGLQRGWAGKALNGDFDAKGFRFVGHLVRRGLSGRELLMPPVTRRGELSAAPPLTPRHKLRPSIEEMAHWMESIGDEFCWRDPKLEYCNVFDVSDPDRDPVCEAAGRYSTLAIEAGVTTPEEMDLFVQNSDAVEYARIFESMRSLSVGETKTVRDLAQTLYIPGDRFEVYGVDTVKSRVGQYVICFGVCRAVSWKSDPSHPYSGRASPAMLAVRSLRDLAHYPSGI